LAWIRNFSSAIADPDEEGGLLGELVAFGNDHVRLHRKAAGRDMNAAQVLAVDRMDLS
jgi:hypothetical protein